jgi:hypothetical protein
MYRKAFVHRADLVLNEGVDPAEPGAAVTVALCGHWEHEGPCRWPHNNEIDAAGERASFRTVFAADPSEEDAVRARIDEALRTGRDWSAGSSGPGSLAPEERTLGRNLVEGG